MERLLEKFSHIPPHQWDYYYHHGRRQLSRPDFGENNHGPFIKNYFKRAGKDDIFRNYFKIHKSLLSRSTHSISTFFLGIIIYHNTRLKDQMNWGQNPPEYDVFPFVWFLTCLFHDMGHQYEESKYLREIWDIDTLKKNLHIRYDLLCKNVRDIPQDMFCCISKYFLYKRFKRNEIDHGIVAGLYLYDKLVKNRRYKRRQTKHTEHPLWWGDYLDEQYALAGATIAIHNIWLPNEDAKEDYKLFDLDELINRHRISLEEAPLLFLLGLVDTIDPIKLYTDRGNAKDILNNILIGFRDDEIILKVAKYSHLDRDMLVSRCNKLIPWLNLTVTNKDDQISIEF